MGNKVFHVSDEIHKAAHAWCDKNDIRVKEWVEGVITNAIMRKVTLPGMTYGDSEGTLERLEGTTNGPIKVAAIRPLNLKAVEKKPSAPVEVEEDPTDDLWTRPPFWKGDGAAKKC